MLIYTVLYLKSVLTFHDMDGKMCQTLVCNIIGNNICTFAETVMHINIFWFTTGNSNLFNNIIQNIVHLL